MTKKMTKTRSQQVKLLEAYIANSGNLSKACRETDISRSSHYKWMKDDDDYPELFREAEDSLLDTARECLHTAAEMDWKAALALLERKAPREFSKEIVIKDNQLKNSNEPEVIVFTEHMPEGFDSDAIEAEIKSWQNEYTQ